MDIIVDFDETPQQEDREETTTHYELSDGSIQTVTELSDGGLHISHIPANPYSRKVLYAVLVFLALVALSWLIASNT